MEEQMSTLVWTGGGNNRANNPADWTDQATGHHRAPQPGDALAVQLGPATMNIFRE
jgi:hypothetical protein